MTQRGSDGKRHYNIFRTWSKLTLSLLSSEQLPVGIAVVVQSVALINDDSTLPGSEGNRDRRGGRTHYRPGEVWRRELLESFQAWPAGNPCCFLIRVNCE